MGLLQQQLCLISCFYIKHKFWADLAQTNFRTFETTDPPLDDANLTNSWNDAMGLQRGIQAWNGVDGTPLASSSYGCFHASIYNANFGLIDFSQTNFRTFETTDPSLDDANHTNSQDDGVSLCQDGQAWNGVDGTPLAVVMSVSMLLYTTQILG